MGYAQLNIWFRDAECRLLTMTWKVDLVIRTCGGDYLVDMDPSIIECLKQRYPDYHTRVEDHQNEGYRSITFQPESGKRIYHVEVPVPPGCYVVWAKVCVPREHLPTNIVTNKVMVIVCCDDHACVNLLLDYVVTCAQNLYQPGLERAVALGIPEEQVRVAANVLMAVAEKTHDQMVNGFEKRAAELEAGGDTESQQVVLKIIHEILGKPAAQR